MKYLLPVITLLIFIFFAGLKVKPDILPCSKMLEGRYFLNGKQVRRIPFDSLTYLSTEHPLNLHYKASEQYFKTDSIIIAIK